MPIVCLGLNHRTAPVEVRERFAIADKSLPDALARVCADAGAQEAVILSTCNRVEIYAATTGDGSALLAALRQFILAGHAEPEGAVFYSHAEPQSVQHLFKVASGLDSMILGETEILGQLKTAYDVALQHKRTGPRLNKAFQRAFNAAKLIRTETNIQRGSVSVASVAVELAEKIFDTLNGRTVMVIGAGDTGEKTARALLSRGAQSVLVSNRSHERAEALAQELGGRAVQFDAWEKEFALIDIVISSTSAPHYVLDRKKLEPLQHRRHRRPLLLIDIAVPRDIEPEVNFLEDVYLYNIDDLQAIAADYLRLRQEEVAKCESIIADKAREMLDSLRGGPSPLGDARLAYDGK
ncbi:MAG: glutamyl-tRNA reductase [Pedosphaera sp.]|nr:glutamyl-tRNA reductase [Pedosphaera sp.]MSU43882.1 glutamyl-tRNA reductase [Pedosphaera sp.]